MFGFGKNKETPTADLMRHPSIRILKLSAVSLVGTETHVYQVQVRKAEDMGYYWEEYGPQQISLHAAEIIRDVWIKNLDPEIVG